VEKKKSFVMMVQKRWWDRFCRRNQDGKKIHSFVLRGKAPPKDASTILFYVTKPVGEISGYANFLERKVGSPDNMWKEHGDESVLSSREKYDDFLSGSETVSFVRFNDLHETMATIPLNRVLMSLGVERLSRKGFYIDKEKENEFLSSMKRSA
jgi:predicted transcriptional regulator